MLFILEDLSYLELTETQYLRDLATTTQKQTWGLIKYLRNN
jgi:hypothetical protein